MASYFTTDTLIEDVKRRGSIPQNQQTFKEADFLAFANDEMMMGVVPHILLYHENYFLFTETIDLETDIFRYQIPSRAVGNRLRELSFIDSSGNIFEMSQISIEDLPTFQNTFGQNSANLFYVEGSEIVLVNETSSTLTGSLRFSYYLRPNELVPENTVSIITNINRTTGVVTVDTVPDNIVISGVFDLIQTKSPHRTLGLDLTAISLNNTSNEITFDTDDIPSALTIGDHIALAEQTIVVQAPTELHSMLSQRIVARCLESLGDSAGLAAANAKISEMEVKTGSIIDNRIEGAALKVINRHGFLRRGRNSWR